MVDLPAYTVKEKSITAMELTPKQQATELIRDSQNILLITHDRPDGDAIGSILALSMVLQKMGKTVQLVASGNVPASYSFLPGLSQLQPDLQSSRDFVISIDTAKAQIEKILYKKMNDERVNIYVTPKGEAAITEDQISFTSGQAQWQTAIILDCSDITRIGSLYEEHADLFYAVPVINIDHHPGNDYFGKVNLVDFTATSTAEILVSLIESLGREKSLLDEDVATNLLTGIMSDTASFQNSNTTPKSFTVAAQLVAAGARQQEIVRNVFKTKALSTLRLWGKVLAKLQEDKDLRFVWSAITAGDIEEAGATPEETGGVIDELLKTAENVDFALLLSERGGQVHGNLRAIDKSIDVSEIAALFGGGGHVAAAAFDMDDVTLEDVQQNILFKVKQYQAKRLQQVT